MANKTLNQVISLFQEIAEKHKQINHFYFGSFLSAMKEENITYPLLVVDTISGGLTRNDSTFNLIISVCDKVYKAHDNMNETQSDTFSVIEDIRKTMESDRWKSFSDVTGTATVNRFVDDSLDEVTGWAMNMALTITSKKDLCAIPYDDYDFDGDYVRGCDPVEIFEDGILVETVESGDSYSYSTSSDTKRTSEPFKTGQTVSFQSGDDGDLENGNGVDFYTLSQDNPFDNAFRFTDLSGNDWNTGSPTGDLVIDWSTADYVNDTVLVWHKDSLSADTWSNQITACQTDQTGSYPTGWYMPNVNEFNSIMNWGITGLDTWWSDGGSDHWTSTTYTVNTGNAIYSFRNRYFNIQAKTGSERAKQVRLFTFTEIGV